MGKPVNMACRTLVILTFALFGVVYCKNMQRETRKKLLDMGSNSWGPRLTQCNLCFIDFPHEWESCAAYGKWKDVQECAMTKKDDRGNLVCNEWELGMVAGTCIVRNAIYKVATVHCMSNDYCSKFLETGVRTSQTQPTPLFNGTKEVPNCANVTRHWFYEPPSCSDKDTIKTILICLKDVFLSEPYQLNDIAKGYIRSWFEEFIGRTCGGETFASKGAEFRTKLKLITKFEVPVFNF